MKRDYDEVLSEYGISAYDETSQGAAMTQREELSDDQKKLTWLLGLEKETLEDMAHQQSKIIEKLQNAAKEQTVPEVNKAMLQSLRDMVEIVGANFCSNQDVKRKYKIARELLEQNK